MPRPRRKSEAPKLRLIQGGARAVVPQRPMRTFEPPARPPTQPAGQPPTPDEARSSTDEQALDDAEPAGRGPASDGGRRAWVAALAVAVALVLAYFALRRRG